MTVADLRRLLPNFRTKVIADLIGIALAALLVWVTIVLTRAGGVDMRTAHLSLTLATVAVAGAVAVALGTQAPGHRYLACLGAVFGLHAILNVALSGLGPRTLHDNPALLVALSAGTVAVPVLLLLWATYLLPVGRWATWEAAVAAAAVALVLGVTAGRIPAVSALLNGPAVDSVVTLGWAGAAVRAVATGLGRRDQPVTRVGWGLTLIAFAQLYRAWTGAGAADPDLLFSGLQLVGTLAVLGGVVGRHRGDLRSLQAEHERQHAALRHAVRNVERAATVAAERDHELANGLAGLAGIAYLLDQPVATSDGAQLRSAVLTEITRLHGMLAGPGRRDEDGPFDVSATLTELVVLRRATGMRVSVDARDDLVAARGRGAFAQAVTNLLTNCERHAPGSRVVLRAFESDDRVVVEVRDDGPGLPPGRGRDVLERGVTAGPTGGSGLGLHVSARLVREQGGDLRVLPRQPHGRGFAVRLELPRSGDRAAPAAALDQAALDQAVG